MKSEQKISILFVCMGNICRSPTAEGVFRKHVSDAGLDAAIQTDSAGTHAYHSGEPADRRAHAAAARRGFSLEGIRARRVTDEDFERLFSASGLNVSRIVPATRFVSVVEGTVG